ncbi:malate dehydrogenase [Anoxybacter fermentans]|uniref:Malate dehydrogenase n=1 Tax=Anoxybacter fermentans TaxID=1323375 RepID=A0A3S9SX18_9FIRM|nr:malic enzyme-like NAD(P)-binding protein [Anoxybacter fermentans]AZR72883.1 malate dehydrogenase [Anoxybacter fermentans]
MKNLREEALKMHLENRGKLEVKSKVKVKDAWDLSLAYSPGVAEPCKEIHADRSKVNEYTARGNMVAVVSTGTAVLGLGDIGPEAALPVMEGKAVLFKNFAGVDAFPLCISTKDVDEVVKFCKLLEPTFAGINLEDIAAPACFEIEERLKKETNMAIFHDDQHGTAIVTLAGLINALKVTGKKLADLKIVVNGAGASAIAVTKLIISAGADPEKIIMCDSRGALYRGRTERMNKYKEQIAEITNGYNYQGDLSGALKDADVFIGLSVGGAVNKEMVKAMNPDPILFPMANPVPEIIPEDAKEVGVRVIGTGRSDYPNQINNVLAFPGVFRGALDVEATEINEEMKVAAAHAIANLITDEELSPDYIIPNPFDERVAPAVAAAVGKAAIDSGVARKILSEEEIKEHTKQLLAKIK